MARSKRDQLLDRYEKEIRNVMARTLWVTAYADYAENATDDELRDLGGDRAGPGEAWEDVAPETPPAAHHAARDLAELFGISEKVGRRRPMLTLYELAMHAHHGQPPDLEHLYGYDEAKGGMSKWSQRPAWAEFGSDMVMEALGTGVSWFDDHKQFELAMPSFECHYDGTELMWSGKAAQGWDEGHVHTSYAEHGFDLTMFKPDGFERVLRGLGIKVTHGEKRLVYEGPTGSKLFAFIWKGRDIEIVTGNNPITGEYGSKNRNREKDYASYMGVRGTPKKVMKAVELIREFAQHIKDEDSTGLSFIDFGDGGPPELRKNGGRIQRGDVGQRYGERQQIPLTQEELDELGATSGDYDPDTGEQRTVEGGRVVIRQRRNPAGRFTDKGERMYQEIKAEYEAKGDPRAAEIAARTVYARARDGVSGLLNVGRGRPPGVPHQNSPRHDEDVIEKYGVTHFISYSGAISIYRIKEAFEAEGRPLTDERAREVASLVARMTRSAGDLRKPRRNSCGGR